MLVEDCAAIRLALAEGNCLEPSRFKAKAEAAYAGKKIEQPHRSTHAS
jgi:hypothetical protein